jgi:hypothetical protein
MKIRTNLATGIIFGVLSGFLLSQVTNQVAIPTFDNGGPSPRIIPYITLSGIFISAVLLVFQSLVLKKEKVVEFNFGEEKAAFTIIGTMLLFGILMLKVGFVAGVVVALPLMLFLLGERKPFIYIFTVVAGFGVYFLFINVFKISLPAIGIGGF